MKVDIKQFCEKYGNEYRFLYDNHDNVAGFDEAWKAFDFMIKTNGSFKAFAGEFCKYTQDFISSDREAAAFMFTMESMGLL